MKYLSLVSNMIIEDIEKTLKKHGIKYKSFWAGAPRYRTYIFSDATADMLLKAMPFSW